MIYVNKHIARQIGLGNYPCAGRNPSVKGMRKQFWGRHAKLIKHRGFVYNVSPQAYANAVKLQKYGGTWTPF
jgi:hypothetical protein